MRWGASQTRIQLPPVVPSPLPARSVGCAQQERQPDPAREQDSAAALCALCIPESSRGEVCTKPLEGRRLRHHPTEAARRTAGCWADGLGAVSMHVHACMQMRGSAATKISRYALLREDGAHEQHRNTQKGRQHETLTR